ncbi:unnamed protein product [Blepharisma stoltei]|uniref:Uncharacterized protein n=1 Tax=Blepharisma stoltei TaxID=1481888 RepID=A0AAU9IEC2_9CILI|nr:unnamed protein product [Blepharisma stoltei]
MKWLLCLFGVLWTASSLTIGSKDSSLDPGKITWWQDTWSNNAIELSQTNQGSTGVVFTFHFRPSTSISSGVVQITFPSSITISSGQTVTISPSGGISAQTDMSVATGEITLPSSQGVFGPFSIVTRASSTGQIVDANYFFGCIATSASTINSSTLSIATVSGAEKPIVGSTDGIYFTFTLTTSLWKHDLIEINTDSNWKVSNATCSSVTVSDNSNLLIGPDGSNNLPCQTDSSGHVFIYGISQDVLITETTTSLKLKISVSTFTLPGVVLDKSAFTWSVYIWRWGTNTLLANYASVTGPVATYAGGITASSWSPMSTIAQADTLSGMTLFTNLTFVTSHDISSTVGRVSIEFTNVNIGQNWWVDIDDATGASNAMCYVSISGSSCSISSASDATSKVVISFTKAQPAGSISLIVLSKFSSSPSVNSITTYDGYYTVDQTSSSPISWALGSTSKTRFSKFKHHAYYKLTPTDYPTDITLSTGYQGGGEYTGRTLWFVFKPANDWDKTTTISINLPLVTTGVQFTSSYISSSATKVQESTTSLTTSGSYSTITVENTITPSSNQISVELLNTDLASSSYYLLGFYTTYSTTITTEQVAFPFVASNKVTFYECWAKATTQTGGPLYDIDSYVFTVTTKTFSNRNTISTVPLCSGTTVGIPLVSVFKSDTQTFDFGSGNYYIDITVSGGGDLGTGLATGASIPVTSTASSASAVLTSKSSDTIITLTGLGPTTTSSTITTYIAVGNAGYGTYSTVFYYTSTSYPGIQFQLYGYTETITKFSEPKYSFNTASGTAATLTINQSGSLVGNLILGSNKDLPSKNDYFGIGFPEGFTTSSSTSISLGGVAASPIYRVSSPTIGFKGAFIITQFTDTFKFADLLTSTALTIDNIAPPSRVKNSSTLTNIPVNIFIASSTIATQCTYRDTLTNYDLAVATLKEPTFSPTTVSLKGPDSVDTTITISFSTVNAISAGGSITIVFAESWDFTYVSFGISGLSDQSSSQKLSKQYSSSSTTLVISQFAAVSSSTSITITANHVFPPSSGTDPIYYITSIYTQDADSNYYIDSLSTFTAKCSLTAAADAGTTTNWKAASYPNQAGIPGVDFFLSFSLPKRVPAGGTISISAFDTWQYSASGDIKNSCWSNIVYSSCTVSSGSSEIILTLSQDLLSSTTVQVYLDNALNLPSSAGTTSGGFKVISAWNGVTITSDTTAASFTVNSAVTGTLVPATSNSLTMSITNAAEYSSYTFRFTSAQVDANDYFWIIFPRSYYDPYIGKADNYMTDCEPYSYYIPCSSSSLGSISCTADHWYVVVSGIDKTVSASTTIDITISEVMNPAKGQTGNFEVYHLNSAGTVKAYEEEFGTVTTTDLAPSSVIFKSISTDQVELLEIANYTLEFYYAGDVNNTLRFEIGLPSQYDNTLLMNDTTSCSSVYYDQSGKVNTSSSTALSWFSGTSCNVEKDKFELSVQTTKTFNFNSADMLSLEIEAYNPQWGFERHAKNFDYWDIEDNSTFSWHDYWSSRFEIKIYNDTANLVLGKSYGVLNSAYIGYNRSYIPIEVNSYSPKSVGQTSDNRIRLLPGTQSDDITISIGNWPMRSKKLILTPHSNPNYPDDYIFEYSSTFHDWTILQMYDSMTFRIAALSNATSGLYYIDWSTEETVQPGVSSDLYGSPYSILVEVCEPETENVAITVGQIPNLVVGYTSIPISVTLGAAPATDITVWLSFNNAPSGIFISPTYLMFGPNEDVKYFELFVNSTYATSQKAPVLKFDLSGTDEASYTAPSTISLTVNAASTSAYTATTVTLASSIIDGNHAKVTISSTQNVVIYWWLACTGGSTPSYRMVKDSCKDLVDPSNSTLSLYEQRSYDYLHTEIDPNPELDSDYYAFFRRLHRDHCNLNWYNMEVLYASGSLTLDFDWLHADTTYNVFVYADNRLYSGAMQSQSISLTTPSLPSVYTYTVSFSASVASSKGDDIRNAIAKNMGINPGWLTNQEVANPSTGRMRMLASSTTFTYEVLYDRSNIKYSPLAIIANLDVSQVTSDLTALTSATPTLSNAAATSSSTTYPSWIRQPVLAAIGQTNVTFIGTPTQSGIMCVSCSRKTYQSLTTYAWQIISGLDGYSDIVPSSCSNSTANKNITMFVDGLRVGTPYNCSFTACNDYPLWPTCIDATTTTPSISTLPIYTILTYEIDGASAVGLFMAFFLIFN